MTELQLMVLGDPVPSGRPRARIVQPAFGPPFIDMYMPAENKRWALAVRKAFDEQHPNVPRPVFGHGIAVGVSARMVFSRPDSHYGTGRNAGVLKASAPYWHLTAPDVDNVLKLAMDALGASRATKSQLSKPGRVFHVDSQVAVITSVEKVYVEQDGQPRLELTFSELEQRSALGIQQLALVA